MTYRIKERIRKATLWILFSTLLLSVLSVRASGEDEYLFTYEDIQLYRRHSDQGNYCFWVSDAIFTEAEAEAILAGVDPEMYLLDEMEFLLREIGSYQVIDPELVSVDFSSLYYYDDRVPCEINFSFDNGYEAGEITAYVYVIVEEEEPQTQDETNFELPEIPTEDETEPTEAPTESEIQMTETDSTEPDTPEEPETRIVYQEEVKVIRETEGTEATSETESETATETETTASEENQVIIQRIENQKVIEEQETDLSAEEEAVSAKGVEMVMSGPLYVATFGVSGSAFCVFYISIAKDLKMLAKHHRKVIETLKKMDIAKIRGGKGE